MDWSETARAGYRKLWGEMTVNASHADDARKAAATIVTGRDKYRAVEAATGVPWWWIGIAHQMEGGCNFKTHLHNGDSLARRTVQRPAGRPADGNPPFTWEASAQDALRLKELHKERDWSISKALYNLERYNGFGYVGRGINSPYIWSFSNLYRAGKYVRDGVWNSTAVSGQCGAAVILRTLIDTGVLRMDLDRILDAAEPAIAAVATATIGPVGGVLAHGAIDVIQEMTPDEAPSSVVAGRATTALPVPVPPPSTGGVLIDTKANLVSMGVAIVLFVIFYMKLRDVQAAQSIADAVAPTITAIITLVGGGAMAWLQHRVTALSNANTILALAGGKRG